MNLNQKKYMHIQCPNCGYDVSCNSNKLVNEHQAVSQEIKYLTKRIVDLKQTPNYKSNPEYKRICGRLEDAKNRASLLKQAIRNVSENTELEKYKVFYNLVKNKIGKDATIKLIREAEDCIIYDEKEMYKQKYTNFNGV